MVVLYNGVSIVFARYGNCTYTSTGRTALFMFPYAARPSNSRKQFSARDAGFSSPPPLRQRKRKWKDAEQFLQCQNKEQRKHFDMLSETSQSADMFLRSRNSGMSLAPLSRSRKQAAPGFSARCCPLGLNKFLLTLNPSASFEVQQCSDLSFHLIIRFSRRVRANTKECRNSALQDWCQASQLKANKTQK